MNNNKYQVRLTRVNLCITNNCNLHCRMCDYPINKINEKELSFSQIISFIDDAHTIGLKRLELSGGEPMIRKDIFEIIKHATDLSIKTDLMSNGTLMEGKEVELLVGAGLNEVTISLEGFEELNNTMRGNGHFRKAVSAITEFRKYEHQMDAIRVGITVSKYNFEQLLQFVKFLYEDMGIKAISFSPFQREMLQPKNYEQRKDIFEITSKEMPFLVEEFNKIIEYIKFKNIDYLPESFLIRIPNYFAGDRLIPEYGCHEPLDSCAVDASGKVYPCWGEPVCVGDITQTSILDIVHNNDYQFFCDKAINKRCKGCLSACYAASSYS